MKSFVLALAASSVLFAVPALAGDGFAGFNVGVHGGYNFANDQFEAPGTDFSGSGDGFIGGLHGGYTASLGERMLLGAEAEVDWAETKSKVEAGGTTVEINQGLGFGASAIVGATLNEDVMAYGKVGYYSAEFEAETNGTAAGDERVGGLKWGIGTQYMVTEGVSMRGEFSQVRFEETGGVKPVRNALQFGLTKHF